jgi:hypothetical protein
MSDAAFAAARPLRLPTVSYGPFRLLEAVPWLMLATALRMMGWRGGVAGQLASLCADFSVFLAFLLAARRMIEFADGKTGLGRLDFAAQLRLAFTILAPILLLMVVTAVIVVSTGAVGTGLNLLLGFDGIAFDQWTPVGMAWSAFLAALTLLMVLEAESSGRVSLFARLKELGLRALCMGPAIVAVAMAHVLLSGVQGGVRLLLLVFWHTSAAPLIFKNFLYFFFVFGFASLRLWVTLAILVFALRESYRRGQAMSAAPAERT